MGLRFVIVLLVSCVCGCAPWETPEKKPTITFPKSRIAIDAVGLELGVAQLDSSQADEFEEFWRLLDQQELPLGLRRRLDENGIRAAIMSSYPPTLLHELVEPKPIKIDELSKLEKQLHAKGLLREKPRMIAHERISNREGESHPISVSDYHAEIGWVIRNGDKQTVGSDESVRGVMTVTTFPQGDGSVRLVFKPEIHHGQVRHRIGTAERSFLMKASQAVTPVDDLEFEVSLRSGESIVIAPTKDVAEMGKLLFGNSDNATDQVESVVSKSHPTHRVLLVRVVQTQMDDLFSESNLVEKLTTTPRR